MGNQWVWGTSNNFCLFYFSAFQKLSQIFSRCLKISNGNMEPKKHHHDNHDNKLNNQSLPKLWKIDKVEHN